LLRKSPAWKSRPAAARTIAKREKLSANRAAAARRAALSQYDGPQVRRMRRSIREGDCHESRQGRCEAVRIARVDPDEAQPPGSLMRFAVDMRKACLFDPASEQLI
jgi:hypothetical protein